MFLLLVDMEEFLCWEVYSFVKVLIKVIGGIMLGIFIDFKIVFVYFVVKIVCEFLL